MKEFYFSQFENRKPYIPVKDNAWRTFIFQVSAVLTIIAGSIYFYWRWKYSINYNSLGFSLTLAVAETLSFFGICLSIFDLWKNKDPQKQSAPHFLSGIKNLDGKPDKPLSVDIFIATINEEAELLRYTIKDAKALKYPYNDVKISIYLLDDGRRDGRDQSKENVKELCEEENIIYLTRENNIGFKAGNLRNGIENSSGDLFVILDADSRAFPGFLENTLGYFRKKEVAWVQTCHWFYDTTKAIPLSKYIIKIFKISSEKIRKEIEYLFGKIKIGRDIYGSDPRQFYEVILRRRNNHNASFCCGAGSVHRREAVMETAILQHEKSINLKIEKILEKNKNVTEAEKEKIKKDLILTTEITPFMFHISEDLYTSMIVHSEEKKWESVLHPYVECKMLSPQDIDSYVKQRTRYAAGSIDLAIRDNPLFKKGLSLSQRLCYYNSICSYFSCLRIFVFLSCPIIFFFTQYLPIDVSATSFFYFFIPFFILSRITDITGSWGVSQKRGRQYFVSLFAINFSALVDVVFGKKIKFTVTPKSKQKAHPFRYAWPHITMIALTLIGILTNAVMLFFGMTDGWLFFLVNAFWGLNNCYALNVFVRAAYWNEEMSPVEIRNEIIDKQNEKVDQAFA